MGPRVLYLHSLRGGPTSVRQQLLVTAFGSESVRAPNLRTRITLIAYTVAFILFAAALIASATCAFLYWSILGASVLTILLVSHADGNRVALTTSVLTVGLMVPHSLLSASLCFYQFLLGCLAYILTGRGVTYYMVQRAVAIAEKEFKEFCPNVIVASSFGAVVALAMEVPRVSLVLLAPAQDQYCRYMKIKDFPSLIDYPYAIIIHGSADSSIDLDDSIRLVETSGYGKCKLEVIDDDHSLSTLSEGDFREFVDEAYEKGREAILKMEKEDLERLTKKRGHGSKIEVYDPTLFDITFTSGAET